MAYLHNDLFGLHPRVHRDPAVPTKLFIELGPISFVLSDSEMRDLISEAQALLAASPANAMEAQA